MILLDAYLYLVQIDKNWAYNVFAITKLIKTIRMQTFVFINKEFKKNCSFRIGKLMLFVWSYLNLSEI